MFNIRFWHQRRAMALSAQHKPHQCINHDNTTAIVTSAAFQCHQATWKTLLALGSKDTSWKWLLLASTVPSSSFWKAKLPSPLSLHLCCEICHGLKANDKHNVCVAGSLGIGMPLVGARVLWWAWWEIYLKHSFAHKNIVGICNMEIEAETEFKKHLISNWGSQPPHQSDKNYL